MSKNLRKYKTIKELKKDKLFKKDDLEMVVAFWDYEWFNSDYVPKGKQIKFENANYLMKDSKNKYYLLCVVRNKDDVIREKPYYEASYIVGEVNFLVIHPVGKWTDEMGLMMASYEYYVPKYKGKHKVVFDHKCKNKVKSNFFTIEEFTPASVFCPVDICFNSNLTDIVDGIEMTIWDVLNIAEEHQLDRVYCDIFQCLYKEHCIFPHSPLPASNLSY